MVSIVLCMKECIRVGEVTGKKLDLINGERGAMVRTLPYFLPFYVSAVFNCHSVFLPLTPSVNSAYLIVFSLRRLNILLQIARTQSTEEITCGNTVYDV